jgi:hypothetical protein
MTVRIRKEAVREFVTYYADICHEGARRTTTNLGQDRQREGQNFSRFGMAK